VKVRSFQPLRVFRLSVHILTINVYAVFIAEITARAFIVADSNKRRTLSRADISKALSKSDQFDFLIDIVPREEAAFGGSKKVGPSGLSKDQVRRCCPAAKLRCNADHAYSLMLLLLRATKTARASR
jgi:hypothetical protein